MMNNQYKFGLIICALCLAGVNISEARQFRKIAPIPVAPEVISAPVPENLQTITPLAPIDANIMVEKIEEIVASWNREGLSTFLDQAFPNRLQLLNVLSRDIPSDAVLQLLSVQNITTLNQHWANTAPGQRSRISNVVATVNLQIRFVDPRRGLITLPHESQFYLRVVESE